MGNSLSGKITLVVDGASYVGKGIVPVCREKQQIKNKVPSPVY
jgi:hypothetical protein